MEHLQQQQWWQQHQQQSFGSREGGAALGMVRLGGFDFRGLFGRFTCRTNQQSGRTSSVGKIQTVAVNDDFAIDPKNAR
jgi:hypothetical protein